MDKKDYRKYGLIGTIVFHCIILLFLLFFGLTAIEEQEEGLLVNFGDSEMGIGTEEPMESEAEQSEEDTPPQPTKSAPPKVAQPKEAINTQDFEESAYIKSEKKKKEEAKKKELETKKLADDKAKHEREEEARKQKEIEDAERKKQAELAKQKAAAQSAVKNAFGGKGTGASSSEGVTQGSGNQGQLTGDPNSKNRGTGSGTGSKGASFSLSGRSLVGTLPKPQYNIQEEGIVVVEITVDKTGKVINAIPILKGTTTQNSVLWDEAKKAAMKAKFTGDTNAAAVQKGTITYHFTLE